MKNHSAEYVQRIAQTLYDKKGMNILALDVREVSSLTDYIILAEGHVDRHVIALAEAAIKTLEEKGAKPARTEGLHSGDWVVVDYFTIMLHVFMPGIREKYNLEGLWPQAKIIDLDIALTEQESSGAQGYI